MRICDLSSGVGRLTKATKRLREQWELTRAEWNDQNAADFERDVIAPLFPQVTLTLAAVQRMAEVLAEVERDCWDEETP